MVVAVLLVVGGSYWFLVVQASAAIDAPATLIVINQPVTVNDNPAIPGQAVNAGNTVKTGASGHASIQFPDGSFVRMAPGTSVTLTAVQLQKSGNLQTASVLENVGRTFESVEHLASGASFKVASHSVTASVRGTKFETLVRSDYSSRIWVFEGVVTVSGKTTVQLHAGDEIDSDPDGNLSTPRANQFDNTDPFPLESECGQAAAGNNTAGTLKTLTGEGLTSGHGDEADYYSPGGTLTVALCYPGSLMRLTVVAPSGAQVARQQAAPIKITISDAAPGLYRALVVAVSVPAGGEAWAVTFATNASCSPDNVDTASAVRQTLSSAQVADYLSKAGISGVSVQVQGTSPTSARIVAYSDKLGQPVQLTIDVYAATPNLGAVITQVMVRGVNVTTQVIAKLYSLGGNSIASIPTDFIVDRVYSCVQSSGDDMMVIEGHR
ncbi:MAG: FecR domain-containing protein [Candidatus Dormibacterales bacterium]